MGKFKYLRGYRGPDGRVQKSIGYPFAGLSDPDPDFGNTQHYITDNDDVPETIGAIPDPSDPHFIPPEYVGAPVHLFASTLVSSGSAAQPNEDALRNTTAGPMEIHEIKFMCKAVGLNTTGVNYMLAGSGLIGVKLKLGDVDLMGDYVPIGALSGYEIAANPIDTELFAAGNNVGGGGVPTAYSIYAVKLKHSIWLEPGEVITPMFQHRGQTPVAFTVRVAYSGRVRPPGTKPPKRKYLPWWATYISPVTPLGAANSYISTEKQLVNPFDQDLEIDKFIGRIPMFAVGSTNKAPGATDLWEAQIPSAATALLPNATFLSCSSDVIRIGMYSSGGYPIIAPLTPFRLAFDYLTREWPVSFKMAPSDYFIAQIDTLAPAGGEAVDNVPVQVHIGMRGWREVR